MRRGAHEALSAGWPAASRRASTEARLAAGSPTGSRPGRASERSPTPKLYRPYRPTHRCLGLKVRIPFIFSDPQVHLVDAAQSSGPAPRGATSRPRQRLRSRPAPPAQPGRRSQRHSGAAAGARLAKQRQEEKETGAQSAPPAREQPPSARQGGGGAAPAHPPRQYAAERADVLDLQVPRLDVGAQHNVL